MNVGRKCSLSPRNALWRQLLALSALGSSWLAMVVMRCFSPLQAGQADALFGDAISLMFWINGADLEGCCRFRGRGFFEAKYFGEGVGIAVKREYPPQGSSELRFGSRPKLRPA